MQHIFPIALYQISHRFESLSAVVLFYNYCSKNLQICVNIESACGKISHLETLSRPIFKSFSLWIRPKSLKWKLVYFGEGSLFRFHTRFFWEMFTAGHWSILSACQRAIWKWRGRKMYINHPHISLPRFGRLTTSYVQTLSFQKWY